MMSDCSLTTKIKDGVSRQAERVKNNYKDILLISVQVKTDKTMENQISFKFSTTKEGCNPGKPSKYAVKNIEIILLNKSIQQDFKDF